MAAAHATAAIGARAVNRRSGVLATALAALVLSCATASAAQTADAERGKVLYETRCSGCHESSVHQRNARKAKSFAGVRAQVLRWSEQVGGIWSADEVDSVTQFLNRRYYGFPCPQSICKADQASLGLISGHRA